MELLKLSTSDKNVIKLNFKEYKKNIYNPQNMELCLKPKISKNNQD